jgi:hypothetical protein
LVGNSSAASREGRKRHAYNNGVIVGRGVFYAVRVDSYHATEELLGEVFSVGSVPRLYNEEHLPLAVYNYRS